MEVSEALAMKQAEIATRYQITVAKGAMDQQEAVIMTLIDSTSQSGPLPDGRGSIINAVA